MNVIQSEISRLRAENMRLRTLASHRGPRYFLETSTGATWAWRNGTMTVEEGDSSIFASPDALLCCPGITETDESGNPLRP